MSSDEMSSVLKGHKYTKRQLLDMSKKSTKEGRHGEADALYKEFQKEESDVEEGYKEIDRDKENRMYRRAGNLARQSLASKGMEKKDTAKKSVAKIELCNHSSRKRMSVLRVRWVTRNLQETN